jgi:hypothetical protein
MDNLLEYDEQIIQLTSNNNILYALTNKGNVFMKDGWGVWTSVGVPEKAGKEKTHGRPLPFGGPRP